METETNDSSFSQDMFADSDEEEEVSFRGTEFSKLKRHAKSCSNWRESRVFFSTSGLDKTFSKSFDRYMGQSSCAIALVKF